VLGHEVIRHEMKAEPRPPVSSPRPAERGEGPHFNPGTAPRSASFTSRSQGERSAALPRGATGASTSRYLTLFGRAQLGFAARSDRRFDLSLPHALRASAARLCRAERPALRPLVTSRSSGERCAALPRGATGASTSRYRTLFGQAQRGFAARSDRRFDLSLPHALRASAARLCRAERPALRPLVTSRSSGERSAALPRGATGASTSRYLTLFGQAQRGFAARSDRRFDLSLPHALRASAARLCRAERGGRGGV